jgi:cytoskeletal protein CcmA (bactofilin family)
MPPYRESRNTTVIGETVRVVGQLFTKEDLYIEGVVEGAIESLKNKVTIGPSGCVHADIHASDVIVLGQVQGNIEAGNKVDIKKSGKLVGDITTSRISMEDGSFFKGRVDSRRSVQGQFSPDGNWVAWTSNESGRYEVYLAPFPGSGGQRQVSPAGGLLPRWREDGKELFYTGPAGQLMAVQLGIKGDELEIGAARPVPAGRATTSRPMARASSA